MSYSSNESLFKLAAGKSSVHAVPCFSACARLKNTFSLLFFLARKKISGTLQHDKV